MLVILKYHKGLKRTIRFINHDEVVFNSKKST